MTAEIRQQNAIRNRVYIAGKSSVRDPLVQVTKKRFETKTTMVNQAVRADRLFVDLGMPNILTRMEFLIGWADLREAGLLEHVDRLASIGQPFDFAIWKQEYDFFDGDGGTTDFLLQRRQAVAYNLPGGIPATVFADYATRFTSFSDPYGTPSATESELTVEHKNSGNIDTSGPSAGQVWVEDDGHLLNNRWVSTVRCGTAPAKKADILVATYLPLCKVVVDVEQPRNYREKLVESRQFRFIEVA
jgi:hypothetical protein